MVAFAGEILCDTRQSRAAAELAAPVYERLVDRADAEGAVLALACVLARALASEDDWAGAQPYADRATELAEARQDWERLSSLLSGHGVTWLLNGRPTGAIALLWSAAEVGRGCGRS